LNFLKSNRELLGFQQKEVFEKIGVNKGTFIRWESGKAIPSDKLTLLAELGFDVQYIVTGVRSVNLEKISKQPTTPHFDFEGKLSTIVKVLEEVLNELQLTLNPKAKGEVVETLLMQAMLKHSIPTKDDIYPILKLVS
jgi:transcriptional regulator with XRE-family HTH domain